MGRRTRRTFIRDLLALFTLLVFVSIWHFGVIVGTHQPVGGDKTAFFYGLMSYYGESVKVGTLPFWNERWGFGFPQLAESQSGALYFPHLILYKLFPVFDAFRINFALHRLLIVLVAFVSFRGMRLRTMGAWLSTLIYVGGGFAVGHFDHQWAMESMVWLPAILWASYRIALPIDSMQKSEVSASRKRWRTFASLPILVVIQLSIGHFQIAFMTSVMSGLMVVLLSFFESRRQVARSARLIATTSSTMPALSSVESLRSRVSQHPSSTPMNVLRSAALWVTAMALGYGIAAAQLMPTYVFAQEVRERNRSASGFAYLSTHSLPPWVNLNLICPSLYFKEPLWRGVVWTPAHSAPEECLNYAGLLPLCIAIGGICCWRRSPFVRTCTVMLLLAMLLSWGPFVQPTFRYLVHIPGFSFFRCSARWLLVQNVAIALLAGWAFDRLRSPKRMFQLWRRSVVVWALILIHIAGLWYAFDSYARSNETFSKPVSTSIATIFPFGDPQVSDNMLRAVSDAKTWDGDTWKLWAKTGRGSRSARLLDEWPFVLKNELLPTAIIIFATSLLLLLAAKWTTRFRLIACAAIVLDLGFFAYLFPDTSVPCEKLKMDGPIASKLKSLGENSRIVATMSNFAMTYGVGSLQSYRTLDVPLNRSVSHFLMSAAMLPPNDKQLFVTLPWSRLGIRAVVTQAYATPQPIPESAIADNPWTTNDPELDLWLDGNLEFRKLLAQRGLNSGTKIEIVAPNPVPALLVDAEMVAFSQPNSLAYQSEAYAGIGTISYTRNSSISRTYSLNVLKPCHLVISELFTKGWELGEIRSSSGVSEPATLEAFDHYFQYLPKVFAPGQYVVTTNYVPPGWRMGCIVSLSSLALWLAISSVYFVSTRSK